MSILTIAIVGGAIATGFYYMNKDTTANKKKLKESTAMVFVLSTGVLLFAKFLGLGDSSDGGTSSGGSISSSVTSGGGTSSRNYVNGGLATRAVPLDYIIGGEPPF